MRTGVEKDPPLAGSCASDVARGGQQGGAGGRRRRQQLQHVVVFSRTQGELSHSDGVVLPGHGQAADAHVAAGTWRARGKAHPVS